MLRKRSQKNLKKASSVGHFRQIKQTEPSQKGNGMREDELKERIAQRNREKLKQS